MPTASNIRAVGWLAHWQAQCWIKGHRADSSTASRDRRGAHSNPQRGCQHTLQRCTRRLPSTTHHGSARATAPIHSGTRMQQTQQQCTERSTHNSSTHTAAPSRRHSIQTSRASYRQQLHQLQAHETVPALPATQQRACPARCEHVCICTHAAHAHILTRVWQRHQHTSFPVVNMNSKSSTQYGQRLLHQEMMSQFQTRPCLLHLLPSPLAGLDGRVRCFSSSSKSQEGQQQQCSGRQHQHQA